MNDFQAYIFHVNREDLLDKAVASVRDLWSDLTVVDNSVDGLSHPYPYIRIHRPSVPLSATQSLNYALTDSRRHGAQICITMHEDAEAMEGSAAELLALTRQMCAENRKWGIIFTNYDSLSAQNTDAIEEVGLWDTFFSGYFGDNCQYRRLELAGYEKINTNIQVKHIGSQTIHSDPKLAFLNSMTFPLYAMYYEAKWGGPPGGERFSKPFNGRLLKENVNA